MQLRRLPAALNHQSARLGLATAFRQAIGTPCNPARRHNAATIQAKLIDRLNEMFLRQKLLMEHRVCNDQPLDKRCINQAIRNRLIDIGHGNIHLGGPCLTSITMANDLRARRRRLRWRHGDMDVRHIGIRNRKAIDNSRRIGAKCPVGMLLRKRPHPMQITLPKLELEPVFRTRIQPRHDCFKTSRRHPPLNLLCLRRRACVHAAHLLFACFNVACKSLIRRHVSHIASQILERRKRTRRFHAKSDQMLSRH